MQTNYRLCSVASLSIFSSWYINIVSTLKAFTNNDYSILSKASSTPSFKAPQIDIPEPLLDPEDYTVWAPMSVNADENSREFWLKSGQHILKETLQRQMNKKVAKNLIILVADGMSIPTQMATRVYMGGEEKVLSFEKFPYVGLSKVSQRRTEKFSFE